MRVIPLSVLFGGILSMVESCNETFYRWLNPVTLHFIDGTFYRWLNPVTKHLFDG